MSNPFATGKQSGSSNPFSGSYQPKYPAKSDTQYSMRQLLMKQQLDKKKPDYSLGSLLKRGGKETLNPVLWAFDKIMRPSWAVTQAVSAGLDPNLKNPDSFKSVFGAAAHGAKEGFLGHEKKGFGEVLSEQGVLKGHARLRGVAGFYGDVAYDPLMLASTAAAPVTGGGSLAAYTALKAGAKVGAKKVTEEALSKAAKAAAHDAGRIVQTTEKASDDAIEVLEKAGPNFQYRLSLAKTLKAGENAHPAERLADNSWFAEKAIALELAQAEERRVTKRAVQLRYGTKNHALKTPIAIKGRQIAPTVPKMVGVAGRGIPVLSKIVDGTGKRFVPGFGREELHAAEMARLKIAQVNNTVQAQDIADIMQGRGLRSQGVEGGTKFVEVDKALNKAVTELDVEDQLHALGLFENAPVLKGKNGRALKAIVVKDGKYVINEKYMQKLLDNHAAGGITHSISPAQAEFVRRWHEAVEYLNKRDMAYGVKYSGVHLGSLGKLYVPHRFTSDGMPINMNQAQKNIFTEAGFQKVRDSNLSLNHLNQLVKSGELPKALETDPYKLLTATSRARAEKQADMMMIRSLENAIGVPTRIVDKEVMAKATARLAKANKAVLAAERGAAKAEENLEEAKNVARTKVEQEYDSKIEAIQKKIRQVRHSKPANKRVGAQYDQINDTWAKKVKQLDTTIKSNITKAQRDVTRLRKEADAAEAQAEKAILGKEVKIKPVTIKQKVDPAKAKALEHARVTHEEATALKAAMPEDYPAHNARVLGELEQEDHLSALVDDFREVKRADYEKGPDGTEEFQGDKADAWELIKEEHDARLEELADDLKDAVKDATEITVKPKVTTKTVVNKGWVTRSTKLAHAKMEAADAAEAKLAALPTEIDDAALDALTIERNDAIERAAKMADINQRRTKKATIAVMENRIGMLRVERGKAIALLFSPNTKSAKEAFGAQRTAKQEAVAVRTAARKEARNAGKAGDTAARGKPNPAYSASKHRMLGSKSTDEWSNEIAYTPEVADAMERLTKIVSGEEKTVDDFSKGLGKVMASWKLLVTAVNPGYRVRNQLTDFWNMWVAGVPAHMIANVGFVGRDSALGVMRRAKKGDIDAIHIMLEAATHGVLSGLFAGDVAAVAKMLKYSASKKALFKDKRFIRLYTKLATDINKNAENWGRLTHYLYRRNFQEMSGAEAAMKVKLAHFDYEDLTQFEQKVMKRIFPFYTWTRKNIPYQVRMLAQEPGRYSAFPKMGQEAGYASGDASSDPMVPSYMGENFYMRIGKNRFFNPQFGPNDLAALQGPGQALKRVTGMISPLAKVPAEVVFNKSAFTGQPITGGKHPREPITPLAAGLLGLIPGNPANVGQTARQGVTGPGVDPRIAYVLGQTPITRFLGITSGGIKKKTGGTNSSLSYLGGLTTATVDQEKQRSYMMQNAYKEADQIIQGLRDAGLLPPAAQRKLSKKEQAIQTSVFGP